MANQRESTQNEGTFSLRKNPSKKQEKAPDFVGKICIHGVIYDLSGWNKVAASGAHWMSGTIKPPYETPKGVAPPPAIKHDDDSIPF